MNLMNLFRRERAVGRTAFIAPLGRTVPVGPGSTLLQAALDAGIRFPHNCRVGSCATCRCRLLEGKVKELSETAYVLSDEDVSAGTILACQSRLLTDIKVELPADSTPLLKGKIARVERLTHDIRAVTVQLPTAMRYKAGQSAELSLGALTHARSYSFALPPSEDGDRKLIFHIRRVPGGEFTGWLFGKDRTGSKVGVRGPFGNFQMSDDTAPVVCVAGGSGMAPIKAMLEDLRNRRRARPVLFFYGARRRRDLYCLKEMGNLARTLPGFRFIPVLSEEPIETTWTGARGLVSTELERTDLSACREAYLCGPPPMIDASSLVLAKAGFTPDKIRFDKFLDSRDFLPNPVHGG